MLDSLTGVLWALVAENKPSDPLVSLPGYTQHREGGQS